VVLALEPRQFAPCIDFGFGGLAAVGSLGIAVDQIILYRRHRDALKRWPAVNSLLGLRLGKGFVCDESSLAERLSGRMDPGRCALTVAAAIRPWEGGRLAIL